jgi:hypothetical protein
MRFLVGTLYSGENEFEECIQSIKGQSNQDYDHIIISNLPEIDAHYKLYRAFLDKADEYMLLIKVDADCVLISEHLFQGIVEKFTASPWLEVMNIGVLDFFTGEMIAAGIQVYRNTVKWKFEDTLYPDIPILDLRRFLYDRTELAPAAWHCKNPSIPQAFHYGIHRGLKAIQRRHSANHWGNLEKVRKNFYSKKDMRLGFAVLGAELVYAGIIEREDQNYTNQTMNQILEKYQFFTSTELDREIKKLKGKHWGFLPSDLRRRIIRQIQGKLKGRWDSTAGE